MREVGQNLGIPLFVFGPETHMTAIVGMALGKRAIPSETEVEFSTANFLLPGGQDKVLNFLHHTTCFSQLVTNATCFHSISLYLPLLNLATVYKLLSFLVSQSDTGVGSGVSNIKNIYLQILL